MKIFKVNNSSKIKIASAVLLIFIFSLIPRLAGLSKSSVTADEPIWLTRGQVFTSSIIHLDFKTAAHATEFQGFVGSHPGLVTAGLAGVSQKMFVSTGIYKGPAGILYASRLPMVFLASLLIALLFFLFQKVWNFEISFTAALLLSMAPFCIGLSRLVHLDNLLTFFMAISIISYAAAIKTKNNNYKIISAVAFSLALLTKITALFVPIILVLWILYIGISQNGLKSLRNPLKYFDLWDISWLIIGFSIFIYSFPLMWSNPVLGFLVHLKNSVSVADSGHEAFFLGKVSDSPSKLFYPVVTFSRMTEIMIVGLFLGIVAYAISIYKKTIKAENVLILIWIIFITLVVMREPKVGDRYLEPIWPALAMVSSLGLVNSVRFILKKVSDKLKSFSGQVAILLVFFASIPSLYVYYPNYYLYYNNFVGGAKGAQKITQVGFGEGHKEGFEYLSTIAKKNETVALYGYDTSAKFYYQGPLLALGDADSDEWKKADYLAISGLSWQRNRDSKLVEYAKTHKPLKVINFNGVQIFSIHRVKNED